MSPCADEVAQAEVGEEALIEIVAEQLGKEGTRRVRVVAGFSLAALEL